MTRRFLPPLLALLLAATPALAEPIGGLAMLPTGSNSTDAAENNILRDKGVAGTYGCTDLTVNDKGVVTAIASGSGCAGGTGSVTSVAAGIGLSATPSDPITTSGTINCDQATSGAFGCVKVDGTSITAVGGVISASAGVTACADLSDDGTACVANTGASGHTLPFLDGTNTWSGTQTFGTVRGSVNTQSGTTYTFAASDCGKLVVFTSATAVTATIPASIVPATTTCAFAVLQGAAGKVSVNGTAVAAATLVSPDSFVATSGDAGSMIGLTLVTVSAATNAYLSGRGS